MSDEKTKGRPSPKRSNNLGREHYAKIQADTAAAQKNRHGRFLTLVRRVKDAVTEKFTTKGAGNETMVVGKPPSRRDRHRAEVAARRELKAMRREIAKMTRIARQATHTEGVK